MTMYDRRDNPGAIARRGGGGLARPQGSRDLWRGDPWRDMVDMQRQMDSVFNRLFGWSVPDMLTSGGGGLQQGFNEPDVDIYETDSEYVCQAALPGVRQEDIDVQVTGNTVVVTAQSRAPWERGEQQGQGQQGSQVPVGQSGQSGTTNQAGQAGQTGQAGQGSQSNQGNKPIAHHVQSRYSRQSEFQFAYSFPEEINPEQVRANLRSGMLEIRMPKVQQRRSQIRSVPIGAGDGWQAGQTGAGSTQPGQGYGQNIGERAGTTTGQTEATRGAHEGRAGGTAAETPTTGTGTPTGTGGSSPRT